MPKDDEPKAEGTPEEGGEGKASAEKPESVEKPKAEPKTKPVPKKEKEPEKTYRLTVSAAPHLKSPEDTAKIMRWVLVALIPAMAGAVWFQGWRSLFLVAVAAASAVVFEAVIQLLTKKPLTILDGSAAVTGVLLAFNLPYYVPWWMPVVGSFAAIAIAKQAFGGLGYNLFNPALIGRAVLLAAWPVHMTTDWYSHVEGARALPRLANLSATTVDAVSTATPLAVMKDAAATLADPGAAPEVVAQAKAVVAQLTGAEGLSRLALGDVGGCIGETSAVLLLIGALVLVIKGIADWRVPAGYLAAVVVFMTVFGWVDGTWTGLFHLLAGGLMLGALFMATDMVTSPVTPRGRWIFGIGCGVLASVIRLWGGYPEGVSYSILLMNAAVPLLDRFTVPKFFGERKVKRA
jgi:electron transport complex protein RnfD